MALRQRPTATKEPQGQDKSQAPSGDSKQVQARSKDPPETTSQLSALLLLLIFASTIGGVAYHAVYRVPKPLSERAPAHKFSEGRALQHVEALAGEIGVRLVRESQWWSSVVTFKVEVLRKNCSPGHSTGT